MKFDEIWWKFDEILTARCASCRRPCLERRGLGFLVRDLSQGLRSPEADTLDKMSRFDVLQALKEILEAGTPRRLKGFGFLQSPGYCLEAEKPSKLKRFRLVQGLGESLEAVSRIWDFDGMYRGFGILTECIEDLGF